LSKKNPQIIFEDELCYVIPDRFPTEYGHLLVISKEHNESVLVTSNEVISDMFIVAKELGLKLRDVLGAKGIAIATNAGKEAGQIVPHFHIHVIPKYDKSVKGFVKHKEQDAKDVERIIGMLKS
jgi:histidine triad (HIT) family protein